jgi:hypothetical protein
MYLENINRYLLERWVVLVPGYLELVLHRGIHIQGSIDRVSTIKRRFGYRKTGVLTPTIG